MLDIPLEDLQNRGPFESRRPYSSISDPSGTHRKRQTMGNFILVLSYAIDWVLLIAFAVAGLLLGNLSPQKRPFNLENPDISFPLHSDTVSVANLLLLSVALPIVVIFGVVILFVPGGTVPRDTPRSLVWSRKIWEVHAGWLGLILSVVTTWFIVSTTKNLLGKPRPNALARCQPDLDNLARYIVGGISNTTTVAMGQLVSADICTNPDKSVIDEGFRSFPSGHSSVAASGLIYLMLFLASKLGVAAPWAPQGVHLEATHHSAFPSRIDGGSLAGEGQAGRLPEQVIPFRRQAAAPPVYLVVLTLVPFALCIFICASRWYDFQHHGFDILFAFAIGATSSYVAFRFYHLPISGGAGWAWAPRSEDSAFWAGVGKKGYRHSSTKLRQDSVC
ncbi:hypothetical protein CSIM01_11175 [Colletotrichum simmondsii]|uniref:Phosphatidic acid phosphatase type 2/haloperoxidase domain-containing protein n=1 Tax=Colletotrichum simmondsii TaxID=703756 RepID=A0A135SH51_9PEZI|nr:hypothetical protein CSIM01_11175 [Colletotrichum simmondsii]